MKFLACTTIMLLLLASPALAFEKASEARQKEVAQRGAQVMPFSLEHTLHIFTKTKTGGMQQVIAKDKSDTDQIQLIRLHLSTIAGEFAHGDFSAPEKIHGGRFRIDFSRPLLRMTEAFCRFKTIFNNPDLTNHFFTTSYKGLDLEVLFK